MSATLTTCSGVHDSLVQPQPEFWQELSYAHSGAVCPCRIGRRRQHQHPFIVYPAGHSVCCTSLRRLHAASAGNAYSGTHDSQLGISYMNASLTCVVHTCRLPTQLSCFPDPVGVHLAASRRQIRQANADCSTGCLQIRVAAPTGLRRRSAISLGQSGGMQSLCCCVLVALVACCLSARAQILQRTSALTSAHLDLTSQAPAPCCCLCLR